MDVSAPHQRAALHHKAGRTRIIGGYPHYLSTHSVTDTSGCYLREIRALWMRGLEFCHPLSLFECEHQAQRIALLKTCGLKPMAQRSMCVYACDGLITCATRSCHLYPAGKISRWVCGYRLVTLFEDSALMMILYVKPVWIIIPS